MARTLDQKIAEAEARLARLRKQERSLETGQKIILGGMVLSAARHDPKIRDWVQNELLKFVPKPSEQKRVLAILEEISK